MCANPSIPMCKEMGMEEVNLHKECLLGIERSRPLYTKIHVHQPPPLMGMGGRVSLLKTLCARNYMKCPELYRKLCFPTISPLGVGDKSGVISPPNILLGLNQMSRSGQKIHVYNLPPSWMWGGVNSQNVFP